MLCLLEVGRTAEVEGNTCICFISAVEIPVLVLQKQLGLLQDTHISRSEPWNFFLEPPSAFRRLFVKMLQAQLSVSAERKESCIVLLQCLSLRRLS